MRAASVLPVVALLTACIFAAGILTACAPAPTPTPTLPPTPTDIPTATGIPLESIPNLSLTVNAPAVGTLVPGVRDVFAPDAGDFQFNQIDFSRTDPETSTTLAVMLRGDGTGERRDLAEGEAMVAFTAAPETMDAIRSLLNRMGFFGMQGTFEGPNARGYNYLITVSGSEGVRQVFAQDSYLPPDMESLLGLLGELGADTMVEATPGL